MTDFDTDSHGLPSTPADADTGGEALPADADQGALPADAACDRQFDAKTRPGCFYVAALLFGLRLPVSRRAYVVTGVSLMLLKYAVEAAVVWELTGAFYSPLTFVLPLLEHRADVIRNAGDLFLWLHAIWSLPFLWIALTMSIRRAADAGMSPWNGLLMLFPFFNLLAMLVLACVPSNPVPRRYFRERTEGALSRARAIAGGIGAGIALGLPILVFLTAGAGAYGAVAFFGVPGVVGAVVGYMFNADGPRGWGESLAAAMAATSLLGVVLLAFAIEGLICVLMAMPIMLPTAAGGAVLGKVLADFDSNPARNLIPIVVVAPLAGLCEQYWAAAPERVVLSSVAIDAPPEVVWQHVVRFPELPKADEWYFRLGIACPQRARIVGTGVGAVRFCEFTTGVFVEPITVWDEPRRLAFDVTEQPAPMFELSPYGKIVPPHMHGYAAPEANRAAADFAAVLPGRTDSVGQPVDNRGRAAATNAPKSKLDAAAEKHVLYLESRRGEFRLVPLSGGRTRLEGRTWYRFRMFPQAYWTVWSDSVIHRVHLRVLNHVKNLSEADSAAEAGSRSAE